MLYCSRSHGLRGNAVKARCAANHDQRPALRDAARPALHPHAARGNEDELGISTLVPKLQLGNPVSKAPALRDGKLELPALNSQAGAWELAAKSVQDRHLGTDIDLDVGRNKTARRQPGWAFPAIGAPETPVLRLTRGQAYSGLRRNRYNDERVAWERDKN